MYRYSKKSREALSSCHSELYLGFSWILKNVDHTILEGHRSVERQLKLFEQGLSQIDGVQKKGKHNYVPSFAVDVAPYPQNYPLWKEDPRQLYFFAGYVKSVFDNLLGTKIRWGGDWNSDGNFTDQNFNDLFHFELLNAP